MIQFGAAVKKRFTLKIGESITRFGSCNPKDEDAREIVFEDERYWLINRGNSGVGREIGRIEIPSDSLVANGYYDHEHDRFKPVGQYLKDP